MHPGLGDCCPGHGGCVCTCVCCVPAGTGGARGLESVHACLAAVSPQGWANRDTFVVADCMVTPPGPCSTPSNAQQLEVFGRSMAAAAGLQCSSRRRCAGPGWVAVCSMLGNPLTSVCGWRVAQDVELHSVACHTDGGGCPGVAAEAAAWQCSHRWQGCSMPLAPWLSWCGRSNGASSAASW